MMKRTKNDKTKKKRENYLRNSDIVQSAEHGDEFEKKKKRILKEMKNDKISTVFIF